MSAGPVGSTATAIRTGLRGIIEGRRGFWREGLRVQFDT